VKEDKD